MKSKFLLEQLRRLSLNGKFCDTKRVCLDSPLYPTEFFTLTPRVCADSLSYADVLTKFSGI